MSDTDAAGCPPEDVLLRYSTDDLPGAALRRVADHVERCATCKEHLHALDFVFAAYRHHADASVQASPARSWQTVSTRSHRRSGLAPRPVDVRRAGQLAAALCIIVGVMFWARPGEVALSADALIDTAVRNEPSAPVASVAVAIAVRSQNDRVPHASSAQPEPAAELARRLSPHAFDTRAPLSARHFRHWRSSLALPRADVLEWETASRVRLSTTTEAGTVRRAELTLEAPDYRAVRQLWRFADGWEVELTMSAPGTPGLMATLTDDATAMMPPAATATAPPVPLSVDELELQARAALHRRNVWPGRDLTLRRHQRSLAIEGQVADRRAVRQLTADAARLERVTIRVRVADGATGRASVAPLSAGMEEWLDATFVPVAARVAFVPRLRQLTHDLDEAAWAFEELAGRYPDRLVRTLPGPSRMTLGRLADAYFVRITQRFEALETHLAPLTGTLARRLFPGRAPRGWQTRAPALANATSQLTAEVEALLAPSLSRASEVEALARATLRDGMASVASSTVR